MKLDPQRKEHRCWSTATVFTTHHHRTDYTWQLLHRLPFNEYTDSPSCFREHCTQAMRRTHLGADEYCKTGHLFNNRHCTDEVIAALPNTGRGGATALSCISHNAVFHRPEYIWAAWMRSFESASQHSSAQQSQPPSIPNPPTLPPHSLACSASPPFWLS